MSAVLFLTVVVIVLTVFWYARYRRTANSTRSVTIPSQNREARIQNQQSNTQLSALDYPSQNQPQQINRGAGHSRYPASYPAGFQGGIQGTSNQDHVFQNPGFHTDPPPSYEAQGNQSVYHNQIYHTLEPQDMERGAGDKDMNA